MHQFRLTHKIKPRLPELQPQTHFVHSVYISKPLATTRRRGITISIRKYLVLIQILHPFWREFYYGTEICIHFYKYYISCLGNAPKSKRRSRNINNTFGVGEIAIFISVKDVIVI